jgi:hypothetical protein
MTTIDEYFAGKPESAAIFAVLSERLLAASPQATVSVGSQISFGARRKFAWVWLYNVTGRTPNGVVHLMLAMASHHPSPHVRHVAQIGKQRWNHQIVVRTLDDARSAWLGELVTEAAGYGG